MSPRSDLPLISWQSRGRRKPRWGGALLSLLVIPAVAGVAMIWAQQTGRLYLAPGWSLAPLGLILLAVSVQLIALVRAAVRWLLVT
jgi:hypothetical protein